MYCKKCGNLLEAGDTVCKNCGEVVTPQSNQETNVAPNNNQSVNVEVPNVNQTSSATNVTPELPQQNNVNPVSETPNVGMPTNNASQQMNMQNDTVSTPQQMNVGETQVQQNTTMSQPQPTNMGGNMAQPSAPMNTQNVNTTNQTGNKNNKSFFIIIVVILAIIIIGLLGVVLYKGLLGDGSSSTNPTTTTTTTNPTQDNNNNNVGGNDVSPVTDSNTISFYGFEFVIPDGYVGATEADYILLANNASKVAVRIDLYQGGKISNIESQSEDLKASLTSQGINVTSAGRQNYEGVDWYIFDCNDGTYNYKYAFVDLGENYLFNSTIVNAGNLSNDKIFADLTTMTKTATYNGSSQFSPSDNEEFNFKVNRDSFNLKVE